MIRFLFILSCISLPLFNVTAVRAQQVFKTTSKTVIGYLEYLPDGYKSSSKDYPVVIFLHGRGEKGPNSTDPRILASGKALLEKIGPPRHVKDGTKFPFILISPQLKSNHSGWPTAYVMEVIEHVQRTLRIDRSRIYITGLSMGGFGTWTMIQQYPDLFAAAAPICGGGSVGRAKAIADENLPVWAFHGDADNVVHVNKSIEMVNAINSHNPNPKAKISIYRGVKHDAWVRAYRPDHSYHNPNVYEWLMSHRNGNPSQPEPSNEAPVADAGPDKKIKESDGDVVIAGSGKDKDGTIRAYAWSKVSGGSVDMDDANKKDLIISGYSQGTYVFKLTVTDDKGATHSDEVKVTVEASYAPPVADAGPDISVELPQNSVTIKGKASAKDGKISSVAWEQIDGDDVQMSGTNSLDLKLEKLTAGEYKFQLTVKTDKGLSDSDEVVVKVSRPSNIEPIANAGSDITVKASDDKVVIKGSGRDEDGTITKYEWKKLSGGDVDMSNTSGTELTLTNFSEGNYVFQLIVTDDKGATDTDDVKLTVEAPEYKAPVANAGPDQEIELPRNSIELKGSGRAEDGKITSYSWKQTAGEAVELAGETTQELSVKKLKTGEFKFRLTVKTDKGLSGSDDVTVTVKRPANMAPVANAGPDITIRESDEREILAGSGKDEDGTITAYQWTKLSGGNVDMFNADKSELTISDFRQGTYVFRLTVTDDKGAKDSDDVQVIVDAPDYAAPVANAGPDQEVKLPANSVILKGSAKSDDGRITSYSWTKKSGGDVELSGEDTPTLTVTKLKKGEYIFRLTVKTNKGLSDSDEVTVNVEEPSNLKPVADAGSDVTISVDEEEFVLQGSGSDKDGKITSYSWDKVSGGSVDMKNSDRRELTISNFEAGTYVFSLTVTDDKGSRDSDEVKVTVEPSENRFTNKAPVADAGDDRTISDDAESFVLLGFGEDEDGEIVSYKWKQVAGETTVTLTDANTTAATVSDFDGGTYVFRLTVTDDNGAKGSDDITVVVKKPGKLNVYAGNDRTIQLPENKIVLKGEASVDKGIITDYEWSMLSGGSATLSGENSATLTADNLEEGVYVFRLTAKADNGLADNDDIRITVKGRENTAPVANAGPDHNIEHDLESFVIVGSAEDKEGSIVSFAWRKISGGVVVLTNEDSEALTISGFQPGKHVFRLTVTDERGETDSDDVTVIVNPPASTPDSRPVAYAGNDRIIRLPINSVTLRGGAKAEGRTIVRYEWEQVAGGFAKLSGMDTQTMVAEQLGIGRYKFRLKATCDLGFSAYDDINITVKESLFPIATVDRLDSEVTNGRIVERDFELDLDKLASTDLTAGAVPDMENYVVAVYNDRGDKIFHGAWEDQSFQQVFQQPGFYVYHVLDGRRKVKVGKLIIQP